MIAVLERGSHNPTCPSVPVAADGTTHNNTPAHGTAWSQALRLWAPPCTGGRSSAWPLRATRQISQSADRTECPNSLATSFGAAALVYPLSWTNPRWVREDLVNDLGDTITRIRPTNGCSISRSANKPR